MSVKATLSRPGPNRSDSSPAEFAPNAAPLAGQHLGRRPPKGGEEVPVQLSRLLHAHEIVLQEARAMARQAAQDGDDGTNDLLVSDVVRTNELQVWFVAEHLVDAPLVRADGS